MTSSAAVDSTGNRSCVQIEEDLYYVVERKDDDSTNIKALQEFALKSS